MNKKIVYVLAVRLRNAYACRWAKMGGMARAETRSAQAVCEWREKDISFQTQDALSHPRYTKSQYSQHSNIFSFAFFDK